MVSRRKARLGDEDKGFRPKPKGPEVFLPQRNHHALIPVRRLSDGKPTYLSVRWPASTARSGPPDPPVIPEVIHMDEKARTGVTYPDPYARAEELAVERKQSKREAA